MLGGGLSFETDGGTTVTVRLPTVAEPIGSPSESSESSEPQAAER